MTRLICKSILKNRSVSVFLCYSHADQSAVRALASRLRKTGIEVWIDREKLLPGQDWKYEIKRAILKSDVMIVCLSSEFNKRSGYRHKELKIALEKSKYLADGEIFIIPVRLENCDMPDPLYHLHRVDLFRAGGYQKLTYTLQTKLSLK